VPPRCTVTFTVSALGDLEHLYSWYDGQGAAEVGKRLLVDVLDQIERLADFPESGRVVPEFGAATVREIVHPPLRVVYRLDPGRVRVVRVWRSERPMQLP
jgi:toxin ParE1/3/4